MAFLSFKNVEIKGISACVPRTIEENLKVYDKWEGAENFISITGIERKRKADANTCSSDLCIVAAEKLIAELCWDKDDIEAIIFVTQTSDYILPSSSAIIQERLGLNDSCYTLDISLGCSGWVYALSVISGLMQNGDIKKGLLLAGDTILKYCSPDDKSTYPLFGDAGTATAIEYRMGAKDIKFCMNTDGKGHDTIIIEDGGCRVPVSPKSFVMKEYAEGVSRTQLQLQLDGMNVFSFGISQVPKNVNFLMGKLALSKENIDYFLFHQANLFMNEKIRKKLKLTPESTPYSLKDFGNTSCASIPLTMVSRISNELRTKNLNCIGCGFGVGLSWGSVYFETNCIVCPEIVEL